MQNQCQILLKIHNIDIYMYIIRKTKDELNTAKHNYNGSYAA